MRLAVASSTRSWTFVAILVLILGSIISIGNEVSAQSAAVEEFVGPFPSWRQVQCGGSDDTALLQNELNTLGRSGSPVLYLKPGTCRITSTLRLGQGAGSTGGVQEVTLLGHDPSDTTILWAGSAGGRMFEVDGVARSRFGRLTWDGGGTANSILVDQTNSGENYFPTGNRHEDEVFKNVQSSGVMLWLGAGSAGTSEWEYMRVKFLGPAAAGIQLQNQNTLDHWLWDSSFEHLEWGVTNHIDSIGVNGGGGDFAVNRSNFLNNQNDLGEGNVQPFASARWNYSKNASNRHINWLGVGRANSAITSQGETIIDSPYPLIEFDTGPASLVDDTFRTNQSKGYVGVFEAYCSSNCLGDLWTLHNTSNQTGQPYNAWRSHQGLDDVLGATVNDPGPINLPATPSKSTAPVIEVANGDIAGALAQAGSSHAIVHIPYGTYKVNTALDVGPNVILTGDGVGATTLAAGSATASPILHLVGPSHAVVRDLRLLGWRQNGRVTTGILADKADQAGGLVHAEFAMLQGDRAAWDISGLSQTKVQLFDDYNGANTHCGADGNGPDSDYRVDASDLRIFNGAGAGTDAMFTMANGASILDETHYFEGNPGCQGAELIAPNGSGTLTIDEGNFAPAWGGVNLGSFHGQVSISNFANTLGGDPGPANVTGRDFGANALILGLAYGGKNEHVTPTCSSPCLIWLPQAVNPNNATAETNNGVTDADGFMRSHLAPLRNTKPMTPGGRASNVTDVRLYRVGAEQLASGIKVVGAAVPPTNTPLPTNTPTQTPTPAPTVTPVPGTSWIVPQTTKVTASNTCTTPSCNSAPASGLFDCNTSTWWNGADTHDWIDATFPQSITFGGIRMTEYNDLASTITYTIYGSNDGTNWTQVDQFSAVLSANAGHTVSSTFSQVTYSHMRIDALSALTSDPSQTGSWNALGDVYLLAAPGTPQVCGVGSTPVPTLTATPIASATNTPAPSATNTPVATATFTPVPATRTPTRTPLPTRTNTPVPTNTPAAANAYGVRWNTHGPLSSTAPHQLAYVSLNFTNTGTFTWQAGGSNPVHVFSYWDTQPTQWGDHELLPYDVAPGQTVQDDWFTVVTPAPGTWTLHITLVREPSDWFWWSHNVPELTFSVRIQ